MADPIDRLRRLLAELKRRKVYRVAAVYAGVAFVTLQAARLIFPATTLEGMYDVLVVIAFVGFPIALVLAWAFEVTPEGVRRTPDAGPAEKERSESGEGLSTGYKVLVGLGLIAAAVAGGWYLTGGGGESPVVSDRSVAVLPFEALGQEQASTLTEGMHSDLQTKLSNIAGLTVTSARSVERYQESEESTAAVARELGVAWIVSGDVARTGDEIRVNVRLVDPDTDTQTWTDSYRRDLTAGNLFDIQSEITRNVARALEAELSPEEAERIERRPTEDLEAYRLYVEGRDRLDTRTEAGMRDAVDYFRRAIRQDSGYALAWSGLADAVGLYPQYGPDSVPADLPDQELAARRALELAPDLAEAHASMGDVERRDQNGPAALRHLHRAVELKPSYADAHHWLGYTYYSLGRLDAAREHVSLAVELNPRHAAAQMGMGYALLAEGEAAKAESHMERFPDYTDANRARVLYRMHRWDELERLSRERLSEGGSVGWRFGGWRFYLARIAVLRGDTATAREYLAQVEKEEAPLVQGLIHAALGEADGAFTSWREIDEWSFAEIASLRYGFPDVLGALRDDPRFRELVGEMNEAWGLNPDGSLPDSVDVSFEADG